MKSGLDWPAALSSRLAPTELPASTSWAASRLRMYPRSETILAKATMSRANRNDRSRKSYGFSFMTTRFAPLVPTPFTKKSSSRRLQDRGNCPRSSAAMWQLLALRFLRYLASSLFPSTFSLLPFPFCLSRIEPPLRGGTCVHRRVPDADAGSSRGRWRCRTLPT
jgi:hypothetical protein